MRCHYKLKNLPFEFRPFEVQTSLRLPQGGPPGVIETEISPTQTKECNPEFLKWVHDNGIILTEGRYFESQPHAGYNLHRDSLALHNIDDLHLVKFNFIFHSNGTEMKWYSTNKGYCGYKYTTDNQPILGYHVDKCKELYSAQADAHCMILGGVIHNLSNSANKGINRQCYSYQACLCWNTAVKQLNYFLE